MAITKEINIVVKESGVDKVNQQVDNLENSLKGVSNSSKNLNQTLDNTKGKGNVFTDMTSGASKLSPAIGGAITGMKSMLSTMWLIVANPLGAILVAIVGSLTLLFKAFTSTKDGADRLSQVMAGLSSMVDVVRDRILNVGNAIVKFFSGDFKGALNEGKKAVSGFGDEVAQEFKKAANATKDLQQVEDAFNSLSVSRAKVNRDLAVSKELLTDENATYAQKKKALEQIKITEGKQTEQELANAKRKFEAIKALNALSDTSREDKKKEQEAEATLFALQEQSARDRRAINKQEKTLLNQKLADEKAAADNLKTIADERRAKQKEANEKAIEEQKKNNEKQAELVKSRFENENNFIAEQLKNEQLTIDEKRNIVLASQELSKEDRQKFLSDLQTQEIDKEKEHNQKITDLNKKFDDEKAQRLADTAVKKEELDYENQVKEIELLAKTELEKQTLIEKLNGEHLAKMEIAKKTDREKELDEEKKATDKKKLYAETLAQQQTDFANNVFAIGAGLAKKGSKVAKGVAIAQATMNTYTGVTKALAETTDPTPSQTLRFANAAAVGIMGAINIAKIASSREDGGTSGGMGSGGGAAPQAPSFNLVQGTGRNQLAESIGQQAPVKAFVVARDMSTGQEMDRNIIKSASL